MTPTLARTLAILRGATRTEPADRFWEGWDAALAAVEATETTEDERGRCGFPSSISSTRCILPLGHDADSRVRFHRYTSQDRRRS